MKFYHALILFPIFSCRTKKADAFTSRLLDIHAKMLDMNKQEVLLQHYFLDFRALLDYFFSGFCLKFDVSLSSQ